MSNRSGSRKIDGSRFVLTPSLSHDARDHTLRAILLDGDSEVGGAEAPALNGGAFSVRLKDAKPWTISDPHLYGLRFDLVSGGEQRQSGPVPVLLKRTEAEQPRAEIRDAACEMSLEATALVVIAELEEREHGERGRCQRVSTRQARRARRHVPEHATSPLRRGIVEAAVVGLVGGEPHESTLEKTHLN